MNEKMIWRGDTSGSHDSGKSSSSFSCERKGTGRAVDGYEGTLSNNEQQHSDPSSEQLHQFLQMDPVQAKFDTKDGIRWLAENIYSLPTDVKDKLLERYHKKLLDSEYDKHHIICMSFLGPSKEKHGIGQRGMYGYKVRMVDFICHIICMSFLGLSKEKHGMMYMANNG